VSAAWTARHHSGEPTGRSEASLIASRMSSWREIASRLCSTADRLDPNMDR
jgi:hypothetical protein